MALWLRFEAAGAKHFGALDGDTVEVAIDGVGRLVNRFA